MVSPQKGPAQTILGRITGPTRRNIAAVPGPPLLQMIPIKPNYLSPSGKRVRDGKPNAYKGGPQVHAGGPCYWEIRAGGPQSQGDPNL